MATNLTINRDKFFSGYRSAFGDLGQLQVDGLEFLLGKLEQDTFSLKQIAYILATIHHETGVNRTVGGKKVLQRFQPIKEVRERSDSPRRKNQDRYWLTGYYGRGYLQITWEANYKKFGIADSPDKALEPETAYRILAKGMREGSFTGKKLSDYINGKADYFNARKIINGLDKAGEIAAIARQYEQILIKATRNGTSIQIVAANGAVGSVPVDGKGTTASDEAKGITTGHAADHTEGTPPPAPAMEIKASRPTLKSMAMTVITFLMAPLTYFGIDPKDLAGPGTDFAKNNIGFAVKLLVGLAFVVVAAFIWKWATDHANQRTLKAMDKAADPDQHSVRLV